MNIFFKTWMVYEMIQWCPLVVITKTHVFTKLN